MKTYTKLWVVWTSVTLAGFAVIETAALISGDMENTLSAHLRLWLGFDPERPWGVAAGVALLGFLGWLGWHLVFDRDKKAGGKDDA